MTNRGKSWSLVVTSCKKKKGGGREDLEHFHAGKAWQHMLDRLNSPRPYLALDGVALGVKVVGKDDHPSISTEQHDGYDPDRVVPHGPAKRQASPGAC